MTEWFMMASWSPCIAGAGIGILIWLAFLLSDSPPGWSTAYAKTAGMVESAISRSGAKRNQDTKRRILWPDYPSTIYSLSSRMPPALINLYQ